ncbi:MAG: hypothetical protein VXZ53_02330, partial [Planctomycetota bacterium]|nr:hypothetical protein [Planctomycetota bacterium]
AWEQKSKCPWVSLYPSTSDDDQIHQNHASGQCLYPNSPRIYPNSPRSQTASLSQCWLQGEV